MFARAQTRRLEEAESQPIRQRSEDVRFALLLTYITLGWMTVEGAASLLLGWASKSLLLEAFGIDSVVELFSAAVLFWRLKIEAGGRATLQDVDLVERRAARLVGYSLYALVAYVVLNSGYGLFIAKRINRHTRKRLGHSHRLGGKDRHADSGRLQIESRRAPELPRPASRRSRIHHLRLSFNRLNDRSGRDALAWLVVARQRGGIGPYPIPDQRGTCSHFRRLRLRRMKARF